MRPRCRESSSFVYAARQILLTLSLLMVAWIGASAQIDRAELEGTVMDATGAVIRGATVEILAVDTGIRDEQQTSSSGNYRFPGLAVGRYTVTVTKSKFAPKVMEEVLLEVGETRTLDVRLQVGGLSEKIEVKASNELANRTSAEASTVITADQIASLPNNGRDWASFTLLAPFAQDDGGGDQRTIRFAGRARDDNNFQFDGVDAGGIQEQAQKSQTRLQISQDAIEEYRVSSALYDAEYGTQAGGQIDVVTKSGTNDFHGSAFGYLRNSVFDARNFNDFDFNNKPAIPPFRMGQYGMTIGGPIVKNRTFFFLSYEGLRQLQSTTNQFKVPSGVCCGEKPAPNPNDPPIPLTVPFQQYTLNTSPIMCRILQAYPWRVSVGNINGCNPRFVYPDAVFSQIAPNVDQVTVALPTTVHEDTWLVRIDHKLNDKTLLYGRAQRDISLVDAPNGSSLPQDKLQTINHPANYLLALQRTFKPNLFNETKLYVNRSPFHNPQSSALPFAVSTSSFVGLNDNNADIEVGTTFGVIDNLTWTHGRHAFKTGLEIREIRLSQGKTADNILNFADDNSFATAQLSSISYTAPWCCHGLNRTFYMPYLQDEWKVTPTLTLTAGLRWEYYGVVHETTNRTTVFDFNEFHGVCLGSGSINTLPVAPSLGPINTPPCPKNPTLYEPNYSNIDPRLALAWAPSGLQGKSVFRAGFGIYHGAAQNDDLNAGLESDTFRITTTAQTLIPAFEQTTPDLSSITGSNLSKVAQVPRALQRHGRRDLYAEEWGLTFENQLPSDFTLSLQYLGTRGVHLFAKSGLNLCTTPVTLNGDQSSCIRQLDKYYLPDPTKSGSSTSDPFGSIDLKKDVGSSTYHALEVSLERRMTNGLSFQSRYTWSHSINDGSVGGGESNGPENVNCFRCDKGPSIFDVRNNVTVDAVYELPFGSGKTYFADSGALGKIIGGWSLSSIGLWHTGHPLTVQMDVTGTITPQTLPASPFAASSQFPYSYLLPDGNDQTTQRPDLVPGVPLTLPGGGHHNIPLINQAAFQAPPVDANGNFLRYGNAPNGVVRGLDSWQIDLALMKETKLTERFSMEFGVEAFNIFNHVQLGDPGTLTLTYDPTATSSHFLTDPGQFGVITSTNNVNNNNDNKASPNTGTGLPRQLQFMLRFAF